MEAESSSTNTTGRNRPIDKVFPGIADTFLPIAGRGQLTGAALESRPGELLLDCMDFGETDYSVLSTRP